MIRKSICLFVSLVLAAAANAQEKVEAVAVEFATSQATLLDAAADQRLRAMSKFLTQQKTFRFNVEITYDAVEPDGQKIQLGRRSLVEVRRPNGLRVDSRGDRGWDQYMTYDGSHFLLHDRAKKVYSRIATPATLDEFFQFLYDELGASPPLVDFLMADPHEALTASAQSSAMLGDAFIAEKPCDHIVFTGEYLDWQLWIEQRDTPWPRKFVITYKDVDVRPQFMAVFRSWETGVKLDAERFDTAPPADATEVPFEREDAVDDAGDAGDSEESEE